MTDETKARIDEWVKKYAENTEVERQMDPSKIREVSGYQKQVESQGIADMSVGYSGASAAGGTWSCRGRGY